MHLSIYSSMRFAHRRAVSLLGRAGPAGFLLAVLLVCPALARAQQPPGAIGRVEGNDISVESGTAARNGAAGVAPGIFVANGSVVTVHSGQARMTLFAGGDLDICGPAKLTVLQSGDAITLALNFGRMRVQLPATTALRIFTPTIIATPLGISGGSRDVTIGLGLDDSLCVLAATGAIQLEDQFTGERLVVPQAGEFFLAVGKLAPVAGVPGSCQCVAVQARAIPPPPPPIPETALASKPVVAPAPESSSASATATQPPAAEPSVEFSVPAHANEAHPIAPAARDTASTPPPVSAPMYKIIMPPLVFSASSPAPPADPSPDMVLLVRDARVEPDYEFAGHVAAPEFAGALGNALGDGRTRTTNQPAREPGKKKGGFWAALKKVFAGGETRD